MKKIIFFGIFFNIFTLGIIIAQNENLYDVNYDKPQKTVQYNEVNETFQKIFLQYESAIAIVGNVIRKEEKERYFKEIENIRETEKINTKNAIEKMRREIYGNEIETVRKQEIERLTVELTEKISQELDTKLSSKYEEKKNMEIAQLYEHIKQEAYKEAEAASKRNDYILITLVIVLIIFLTIQIIVFAIKKIKIHRQISMYEKNTFDALIKEYTIKLKDYNGTSSFILDDINDNYKKNKNEKEKNIRLKALNVAENTYTGDIKEIQDYRDEFSNYKSTLSDYIKQWKNDNTQQIFGFIKDYYGKYKKGGCELYNSIEFRMNAEKKIAKNLLYETASELEDLYKEIKRKDVEKQFLKEQKQIANDFKDLAKNFKKGEF